MIIVAKFGALVGVNGWIKMLSYTDPTDNIYKYINILQVQHKNKWQPLIIEDYKTHYKSLIVKIKNISNPSLDVLKTYINCLVGISQKQLPTLNPGEYYWSQLQGLNVVTSDSKYLGKISYLFSTSANDVIVIKQPNKPEILIPYLKHIIKDIDLDKQEMLVEWDDTFL